ncbi:MAG: hypothetical protein L0Z50_37885 [Verrucomicrobiales bacterium]|nr:hypothetical protein [Verrucomicrobiales bacterium]
MKEESVVATKQHAGAQIFAAVHRRGGFDQCDKLRLGRRGQGRDFPRLLKIEPVAQLREIAPSKLTPPRRRRREQRVQFLILLEMHLIHGPEIDVRIGGQCHEFFYALLVFLDRHEQSTGGVCDS